MARLLGEVNTEEKQALEQETAQLTSALEQRTRTAQLLSIQLKELQVFFCPTSPPTPHWSSRVAEDVRHQCLKSTTNAATLIP